MRIPPFPFTLLTLVLAALPSSGATRYVDVNSTNAIPPYTNWATAANVIQDAVDAADPGDEVLVADGVYSIGGKAVYGLMTNRVAVDKPLTLVSMNGPEFTVIQGHQVPGITNGNGAVRCAYLTNGAFLTGFTLRNGATRTAGHFFYEGTGGGVWCVSAEATVSNCVVAGNSAVYGGGGARGGTLNGCLIRSNMMTLGRGGGGGAYLSVLNSCTLNGNSAVGIGGGASQCTLNACALFGNSAVQGGGADSSTLNNCLLTGNSAVYGGGINASTLNNSIVHFNTAHYGDNHLGGTFDYSCTTPLPLTGTGNISTDPQLASASHLSAVSPCRGAGGLLQTVGQDIDGETWNAPPSIGCDEFWPGSVTGSLAVAISAPFTNVAVGFPLRFNAEIGGRTQASCWDFGDGTIVSNRPYATHAWTTLGNYDVILRSFNETWPGGVSATVSVHVVALPIHHVSLDGKNPTPPYDSWATAATNIQDAVDMASVRGAMILVSNGVYATGGKVAYGAITNRVVVDKPLRLLSVNGPEFTIIKGYQLPTTLNGDGAVRCIYLAGDAVLSGFTLLGGATRNTGNNTELTGGAIYCESRSTTISNCVLKGSSAAYGGGGSYLGTLYDCALTGNIAPYGGGSRYSVLNNCVLTGNSSGTGGGVISGTLNNCTVTGNSATGRGGGVFDCVQYNCIVYLNSAPDGPNYYLGSVNYSCVLPFPLNGVGNITNFPLFVDSISGDFRLQSNSPCINAGHNFYAPATTDFSGNPRIRGGTVDIGAYEFQSPESVISYAWLQQYGLPTDGSMDAADTDNDKASSWHEWKSWTNPTNELSVLQMISLERQSNGTLVRWRSVSGQIYFLERATNPLSPFSPLQRHIVGQPNLTDFTDTSALDNSSFFYRVGVTE